MKTMKNDWKGKKKKPKKNKWETSWLLNEMKNWNEKKTLWKWSNIIERRNKNERKKENENDESNRNEKWKRIGKWRKHRLKKTRNKRNILIFDLLTTENDDRWKEERTKKMELKIKGIKKTTENKKETKLKK